MIRVINNDWQVKVIKINDRTVIARYLPRRIPTTLAMHRRASKIK